MKAFIAAFVFTLTVGGLTGCESKQIKGEAPLTTTTETAPPPGCVDLRARGGAC